jgi:hypothetical protein
MNKINMDSPCIKTIAFISDPDHGSRFGSPRFGSGYSSNKTDTTEQKAWFLTLQNGSLLSCPGMFFPFKVTYSSLFNGKNIYLKYKIEVIKEELSVRRRIQTGSGSALKLALIRNNGKSNPDTAGIKLAKWAKSLVPNFSKICFFLVQVCFPTSSKLFFSF